MAILDSRITDTYAAYNGDAIEIMASLPGGIAGLSCYSPPFAGKDGGLYRYSSSERDLSNSRNYNEFFKIGANTNN